MTYRDDILMQERLLARTDTDRDAIETKLADLYEKQRIEIAGPAVGDGVTMAYLSDRHAGTVIKRTPKTVTVQRDTAKRTDGNGMSDAQSYDYSPNPDGETQRFSLRMNGTWRAIGGDDRGTRLVAGRREYYDYSF